MVGFASKHQKEPPLTRVWKQGGSGGVRVEMPKWTTSGSHLDAREVVVVGFTSKCQNQPPLACIWTRGRWWWESHRNAEINHLQLTFGCKGGGGGSCVKTPKSTTSGSHLDAREVVVVGVVSKHRNGPPLAHVWTRGRWWWWQGLWMSFCPGGKVSNS